MKWRAEQESLKPRSFEIKQEPSVGFYLFVLENGRCVRDELQDSFEIAIESARESYGVPLGAWEIVED